MSSPVSSCKISFNSQLKILWFGPGGRPNRLIYCIAACYKYCDRPSISFYIYNQATLSWGRDPLWLFYSKSCQKRQLRQWSSGSLPVLRLTEGGRVRFFQKVGGSSYELCGISRKQVGEPVSRPRKMGSSFVNCRVCRSFFVYQKGFVLVRGGVVQWGEKREIFSHFLERGGKKAYIPLA